MVQKYLTANTYVGYFDTYHPVAAEVIAGIYMLFAALCLLGVAFGLCGSPASRDPRLRSKCSSCGGRCFVTSVALIGIFALFLNILTALFFIFGTMGTKTCPYIANDKVFTKILDNPANFNNEYILGKLVLNNASYPLTSESVVQACRNDASIWQAVQLSNRFNLTSILDARSKFNVTSALSNIPTINGTTLIPSQATNIINAYQTSGVNNINFAAIIDATNFTLPNIDLAGAKTLMTGIVQNLTNFQVR